MDQELCVLTKMNARFKHTTVTSVPRVQTQLAVSRVIVIWVTLAMALYVPHARLDHGVPMALQIHARLDRGVPMALQIHAQLVHHLPVEVPTF
eukprot:875989-Rhodomonas_salina.1